MLVTMRLVHTADWHLGRTFHGESLLSEQAAMIAQVVAVAREARADAVLVAGDLFDRAFPPADAVRLADDALDELSRVCPVIAISGNHDSAVRLGFGAGPLERGGMVHLRTDPRRVADPVVLGDTCVYAIPYLEPDVVRRDFECDGRGHQAVLDAAMARVRADLATRPCDTRSVVAAHAFVAGVEPSESERDLSVGGAASVGHRTFAGIDYLALGHIHGPQRVGPNGRYAGSPLAFSFSEARHHKSLALVDIDDEVRTELVPFPVPRPLVTLRGTLDELLLDPALREHEEAWIRATVTDAIRPQETMERRFAFTVALAFDPQGSEGEPDASYVQRLRGLDDRALLECFVEDVRGQAATEAEGELLDDALAASRVREVQV